MNRSKDKRKQKQYRNNWNWNNKEKDKFNNKYELLSRERKRVWKDQPQFKSNKFSNNSRLQ